MYELVEVLPKGRTTPKGCHKRARKELTLKEQTTSLKFDMWMITALHCTPTQLCKSLFKSYNNLGFWHKDTKSNCCQDIPLSENLRGNLCIGTSCHSRICHTLTYNICNIWTVWLIRNNGVNKGLVNPP